MRTRFFITILIILSLAVSVTAQTEQLTVEKIYRDFNFSEQTPEELTWLPSSEAYSYISRDSVRDEEQIVKVDAETEERSTVVTEDSLDPQDDSVSVSLRSYQWLPNESGLVFTGSGEVWYYDLREEKLVRLTNSDATEEVVQLAPNSRYISYVREYNLYLYNLKTGNETQLTQDGDKQRFNGKLDWVYQEELVGRGNFTGHWWSPDSRHIAYLQFDESQVPDYPLVDEIPYHPDLRMMPYPKAGDPNPVVKLGVVNTEGQPETTWMDVGNKTDQYIPRVYWVPDGERLTFMRLNRSQQHLEFLVANTSDGESRVILDESDPSWVNIGDEVHFFQESERFLWGSERSGYRHLYLYDLDGNLINQITDGEWMVTEVSGVDEVRNQTWFIATKQDINQRQLYRANLDGTGLERISSRTGSHEISLSPDANYYFDEYSDLLVPEYLTLHSNDGKRLRTIGKTPELRTERYGLQEPEYFTFQGDSGLTFHASILKPPEFDPDQEYPVLIYVYGGPHAQVLARDFGRKRHLWHQMMAQKGYIVFSMDNRGSYGRGHRWEQAVYKQLGKMELRDQLRGVEYLKSLPYVDADRIGIWGWSYGGYMTLYALTHTEAFSTGISVAPVTDWRNYDTIYTERYMGLPSENPDGYKRSAPTNYANDLSGKLLLVHGTADDNVHFQNSVQMIDALIAAGKDFDLMIYPQQQHGISPTKDRIHLYEKMTRFIEEHL
ncbi:MAG: DPP IV N-terminal domain-containing protein [Candidatus Marinimicrobia bacterium]|nr:DPP IV N-terminal domain-containing protein [Candidatus Neomarinimicrobiota bacterium]MCF7828012.1 DPP IV N-terminal domain-containing protein [Candidatus Neomarinimicrobiota bacterium]MCF7879233.1 DPP IV N-terminal domain-containing protein [Candidatus Neomarinimicrobiota bacterium]